MNKQSKTLKVLVMALLLVMLLVGCRRNQVEPPELDTATDTPSQETVEEVSVEPSTESDVQYYVLYLKHKDQAFIFSDTYSIRSDDPQLIDKTLPEFVVDALIRQTGVGELINPIPSATKLLSLEQDGRRVAVNLSQDFATGLTGSREDTEATIAMVVNSLITLPSIDQVTLLIDGNVPRSINGVAIQASYGFITDYYPDK